MKVFLSCFMAMLLISLPGEVSSLPLQGREIGHQKLGGAPGEDHIAGAELRRAAPSFTFGLEDGTPIKIKFNRELSSAREKTGGIVWTLMLLRTSRLRIRL